MNRRLLFLSIAAFLATVLAIACGPDFAPWILGADRNVLQGPTAFYYDEVRKLAPAGTEFQEPGDNYAAANRTAAADRADLEKALQGVPAAQRQAALQRLSMLRDALSIHRNPIFVDEYETPPEPPSESLGVPEGLPGEFADSLRGALL
jgi:hypothetical protein